jgi:hypothetical protein
MANHDKGETKIFEPISLVHYVVNMTITLIISPKSITNDEGSHESTKASYPSRATIGTYQLHASPTTCGLAKLNPSPRCH